MHAKRMDCGVAWFGLMAALALVGCASPAAETASTTPSSTATSSAATSSPDAMPSGSSTETKTEASAMATAPAAPQATSDQPLAPPLTGPKILVSLDNGKSFTLQLDATNAPKSSEGIAALVKKRFYDGTRVHRVEPGFCVQWGDPYSKNGVSDPRVGTGGSGTPLPFEPGKLQFEKGVLGVASKGAGTGGDGQIFVMLGDAPSLNGGYAAIGKVTKGMDVVEGIQVGDKIVSMKIVK